MCSCKFFSHVGKIPTQGYLKEDTNINIMDNIINLRNT